MGSAVQRLVDIVFLDDPQEAQQLQLAAATERLQSQRESVRALDRVASELGIDEIERESDLVPLLFSHSTYKSYPESFITDGRWDRLSMWLDTVSADDVGAVDLAGVTTIDQWIDRLRDAGIHVVASSGTSGKSSFLPMNQDDVETIGRYYVRMFGFPTPIEARRDRPVTILGPSRAPMRWSYAHRCIGDAFGRPGEVRSLTDEPMLLADTMAAVKLRKAMADGSASPSDIAAFEARNRDAAADVDQAVESLAHAILAARDQPQILAGPLGMFWRVMEVARRLGSDGGDFHPDTLVTMGGGRKGLSLPDGYREQLDAFFSPVRHLKAYGMSEVATGFWMCEAGVYHVPTPVMLLMVDEPGTRLLEPGPDGRVEGRVGLLDLSWSGRWGGVITGDKAVADLSDTCPCGRPGPTIEDSIERYADSSVGGDDKLSCGGTIEAYIRGITTATSGASPVALDLRHLTR